VYKDIKQYSDEELLQEMLPGAERDPARVEAAWTEFVARFESTIFNVVRFICHRHLPHKNPTNEDIYDLVQQLFLKLWENNYQILQNLKCYQANSLRLYLKTAAANIALDWVRTVCAIRRPLFTHSLEEINNCDIESSTYLKIVPYRQQDPEQEYIHKEAIASLENIVTKNTDQVTGKRNLAIINLIYQGYTQREIAACPDISIKPTSISSFFIRIRKNFFHFS
jgi:RNA polymerase sigma factor (sigma-70 family)